MTIVPNAERQVFILDDDQSMRDYMISIAESAGFRVRSFHTASEFLERYRNEPGCVISDFLMPGITGLELLNYLRDKNYCIPLILVSAFGDVNTVKKAFRGGAIDFLQKPVQPDDLITSIQEAFEIDQKSREVQQWEQSLHSLLDTLTAREHQILDLLLNGRNNKQIAKDLDLSTRTVETHRANIMKKLNSSSFQELFYLLSKK